MALIINQPFFKIFLVLTCNNVFGINIITAFLQQMFSIHSNSEVGINNYGMEPEAYMTTLEIIRNRGYAAEAHTVKTEDGYILEIHRIPYGLSGPSSKRPPVFLQHGVECQSGDWIINFGNQSLGYMLADVGFDVWIGNYRGNYYSRKHVTLNAKDAEFWNFSWQEHGNYDLPACIDYILNQTGYQQLSYVGHSMGSTGFFVLMSNRTEYNAKIKAMAALAPVSASATNSTRDLYVYVAERGVHAIGGYYELLPHSDLFMFLASSVCSIPQPKFCKGAILVINGLVPNPQQLNSTRLPVYISHFPSGTSSKCIYHFEQIDQTSPYLRAYDYGTIKNNEIYKQDVPPAYNLSKVTVPVVLFWGQNDRLAPAEDMPLLEKSLSNVVLNHRVDNDLWGHMDFIWGIETEKYLNTHVVNFLLSQQS